MVLGGRNSSLGRIAAAAACAAPVLALVLGWVPPAAALPDLAAEAFDVSVGVADVLAGDVTEGCAGGRYGRRLVNFSMRTRNLGTTDLVMGNPGCPNCTLNPGAPCTNPLYVCGTAHGHAHFQSFARNEILDAEGNIVAEGRKFGFCLLDLQCATPRYSCSFQGITAGCGDIYSAGLPCQYVDITDSNLADGVYTLRVTIDPDNAIPEADESNNSVEVPFTIGNSEQVCPVYASSDVPRAIPDAGSVSSTITVPDIGPVTSLRLRMTGTHSYLGDLTATLTSPASTRRTLFSQACSLHRNFDTYLGDGAIDGFRCPATDPSVLRQPAEDFSPFHGEAAGGDWKLTIADARVGDVGALASWSLEICSICGNGIVEADEACDDGNLSDGDCCSADCLAKIPDGSGCDDGNACTIDETCVSGRCMAGGDLACDSCLVCDRDRGCVVPDLVYPCQQAPSGASLLRLRHSEVHPEKDSIVWKWRSQTPVELDELGAPDLVTDVTLCVYEAGALVLSSTIPGGETCAFGRPCWSRREHSAVFKDRSGAFDGLTALRMTEGRSGRIALEGKGTELGIPGLYLSLPATVRLIRSDGTPCWEAGFDSVLSNSGNLFRARSR